MGTCKLLIKTDGREDAGEGAAGVGAGGKWDGSQRAFGTS